MSMLTLTLIALVLTSAPASAASALVFEQKTIELRPAPLDREALVSFSFRNSATSALTIRDVVSTCSCGHRFQYQANIAAGASGTVAVLAVIGDRQSDIEAQVRVTTDESSGQQESLLQFSIRISARPVASPGFVHWMLNTPPRAQVVQVRIPEESPYRLRGSVDAPAGWSAILTPGEARMWHLSLTPPSTMSATAAEIRLATTVAGQEGHPVLIYARVIGPNVETIAPVQVEPERTTDANPLLTQPMSEPSTPIDDKSHSENARPAVIPGNP